MSSRETPQTIWIHALAAKVGGGVTYLRNIVPQMAEQLAGRNARVVLLLPGPLEGLEIPASWEVKIMPRAARNPLTRLLFDQLVLPAWVWWKGGDALFCSASFSPLVKPVRTVALLRNAIHFDPVFLSRETPVRSRSWHLQGLLIAAGAYSCATVIYPSQAMRALVESRYPSLQPHGVVNPYGVSPLFAQTADSRFQISNSAFQIPDFSDHRPKATGQPRIPHFAFRIPHSGGRFLYVMTYTLQKNLNFLLHALIQAKAEGLPVQLLVTSRLEDRPPACYEADWELIREHKLIESGYLQPVGAQYGADLLRLYQEVDACVFASFCESFGHPLIEALALDKPLLCADLPYAREICGESALYFRADHPEDLVALWREWPAPAQSVPHLDREGFLARFSWRSHVARLLDTLLTSSRAFL